MGCKKYKLSEALTDIDGNVYEIAIFGNDLEFMAENLNVAHYRNGDPIPEITDSVVWDTLSTGAWCYYNNDPMSPYGKLYNWHAVNDSRGLAPDGWHIPTYEEWDEFRWNIKGYPERGKKMKSRSGWNNSGNGSNETRFNGFPGGRRYVQNFGKIGDEGYWWSSTEESTGWAQYFYLDSSHDYFGESKIQKTSGFSVRCFKD